MAVKKGGADGEEVRVARVIDFNNAPGVLASTNSAAANLNNVFGANDGERHQSAKLSVLLDGVLVIFIDVVGEVVDGNTVVLDIFHNKLLRLSKLSGSEGIGAADNGDNVDTRSQALHQLNVELTQTMLLLGMFTGTSITVNLPMTSRGDEVKHSVNTVVSKSRVTLDSRLFSQNVIVLALEVAQNFGKARVSVRILHGAGESWQSVPGFVVDGIAESRGVDNGQRNAGAFLIKLELYNIR